MAPLIQPSECSVLFIDPRKQHLANLSETTQHGIAQRLALVAHAACAGAVPAHLAFVGPIPEAEQWLAASRQLASPQIHLLGNAGSSWSTSGLGSALAAQGRSSLVLCGFWFETTVTFIALPALASGFEVFIVLDTTLARSEDARSPAMDRLLHAGAVPTTAAQLVFEWIEASADPHQRSSLSLLVPPIEDDEARHTNVRPRFASTTE
jgi:hypothetical protein